MNLAAAARPGGIGFQRRRRGGVAPSATAEGPPQSQQTAALPAKPNTWQWKTRQTPTEVSGKYLAPRKPGGFLLPLLAAGLVVAALCYTRLLRQIWAVTGSQFTSPTGACALALVSLVAYAAAVLHELCGCLSPGKARHLASKWESSLTDAQRKLVGLPAGPPKASGASLPAKQSAPTLAFPANGMISPPQRSGGGKAPLGTMSCSASMSIGGATLTPSRRGGSTPTQSASTYGSRLSPQTNLDGYLKYLNCELSANSVSPAMETYDPASDFLRGYAGKGSFSPSYFPAGQAGHASSPAQSPLLLPLGPEAPKYRPSPQPRAASGVPREDGRVSASAPEAVLALLGRLKVSEAALELMTERLRAWMAQDLMQPLVSTMESAASRVVAATQAVGIQGINLSELGLASSDASKFQKAHGASVEADDQLIISQLLGSIQAKQRVQQLSPQEVYCYEEVNTYTSLSKVLNGQHPAGLLPPAPRGYIANRVRQLADSSCLMDFEWNKGGDFGGKAWSTELPTDSALMFYLFAAFLDAPHWEWPFPGQGAGGNVARAGPVYLGSLPTRLAEQYTAILPVRPAALSKGAVALLGLGLASANPHFALVLDGEVACTLAGANAVFHAIIMFLVYIHQNRMSMIGDNHLDHRQLNLLTVLEVDDQEYRVHKGHWFGLW